MKWIPASYYKLPSHYIESSIFKGSQSKNYLFIASPNLAIYLAGEKGNVQVSNGESACAVHSAPYHQLMQISESE